MIIYKTTNLVNGKIYVGKDAHNRSTYFGSGDILRRAIAKYGKDNFKKEILERCTSLPELAEREKYWIALHRSSDRKIGYNLTEGGIGGDTYTHLNKNTKERRRKELREAAIRFNRSDEGRKFLSDNSKKMWKRKSYRDFMVKVMTDREITWSDKISKSIKEWHKTNPITKEGLKRMREAGRKSAGREIKTITDAVKKRIVEMYKECGPRTMSSRLSSEGIVVSPYLIIRVLKAAGVYQKWSRGR